MVSESASGDHEIKSLRLSVALVTNIFCCLAICMTIFFFGFNIRYRNFRLIKMSSPNINNIINFNCMLLYICPILNSIKSLYATNQPFVGSICIINQWLIPVCSTAIYTAMLGKAWRIYKIFDNSPKLKKIVIKDHRLVGYISIMCLVDVVFLVLWQIFDGVKIQARYVYETKHEISSVVVPFSYIQRASENFSEQMEPGSLINSNNQIPIIQNFSQTNKLKLIYECDSNYQEVWMTALTMYKIILMMYGIYLAWIIRNVNVPSMNDSKYLLLSTYAIIVCGLGSMTLSELLKDWPDVVQVFFTLGILLATCTTQCLVFIPKIRLWYKRRNDDNFKINLSQIILNPSGSCYFSGKKSRKSLINNTDEINLEDELCELLHENSQLKNYLKEKEEIIKLLQDKVRVAKASFLQGNRLANQPQQQFNYTEIVKAQQIYTKIDESISIAPLNEMNSTPLTPNNQMNTNVKFIQEELNVNNDLRFSVSESAAPSSVLNSAEAVIMSSFRPQSTANMQSNFTEQLRNDLDEVEALTSRVRDSISIDLSNTRRYSPLLYEYYRKQLELAKSIQCTYNIQCNTLFDAMTLMRTCLKDYCQTVHNPEYLAIDSINVKPDNKMNHNRPIEFSFTDYLAKNKNNLNNQTSNQTYSLPQSVCDLNAGNQLSLTSGFDNNSDNMSNSKSVNNLSTNKAYFKNSISYKLRDKLNDNLNNTILTNLSSMQNTSVESTTSTLSSSSSSSFSATNNNAKTNLSANCSVETDVTLKVKELSLDKNQTYV